MGGMFSTLKILSTHEIFKDQVQEFTTEKVTFIEDDQALYNAPTTLTFDSSIKSDCLRLFSLLTTTNYVRVMYYNNVIYGISIQDNDLSGRPGDVLSCNSSKIYPTNSGWVLEW